ncbi:MAG: phosphoglycerate dehydrogenase [Brooklawnia sp.]
MKALLLENIHPEATKQLVEAGYEVENRRGSLGERELIDALRGVSLLGIRSRTQLTEKVFESAAELQAVGAFCIGTNQIDLDAAARAGIACFNAPYSNTRSVVELAMAEIVVMARHLTDKNSQMHQGYWDKSAAGAHEVRGRSLGLVGYGNIGSQLSVLAESFGMRVSFYDVVDKLALGNARRVDSFDELLATCETISIHVDGRAENQNLFGPAEFARMRPRSLFLNLSRGHVVDIPALAAAIRSGHIAGASVDVFPTEPRAAGDPFANELQGLPNVILTPHVGGSTLEAQVDIGRFTAGKLIDYMNGGSTVMSVNLPQVQVTAQQGHRVIHIHRNVPGVLAQLNNVLSEHNSNIAFQALNTNSEVGYVVTDVTSAAPGLATQLAEIPETIRVRVI